MCNGVRNERECNSYGRLESNLGEGKEEKVMEEDGSSSRNWERTMTNTFMQ